MKKWQKIFIAIYAIVSIVGLLLTTAKASSNHAPEKPLRAVSHRSAAAH